MSYNIEEYFLQYNQSQEEQQLEKPEPSKEELKELLNNLYRNININNIDSSISAVKQYEPKAPVADYQTGMWNTIGEFDTKAWSKKNVGLTTGWKSIDDGFDGGLLPGFIIIAGDSNLGKSGFMTQLSHQLANNNDDVYIMDFSLDDPMPDKISRVVGSMNKVILNAVKCPNKYRNMPMMLLRREVGLLRLKRMCDKYTLYDANFSTFIEDIEEEIERKLVAIRSANEDKRLVVCIDNMHDLNIKNQPTLTDKQKYDTIAQWCSDIAIKHNLILIASAELKKLNSHRRPSLDDIREAVKIKYEAKAVLLVYNEVSYKAEGASIFYMKTNSTVKQPVFEVHFAKNKFHNFKGRVFFDFMPDMGRFEEVDEQTAKTYSSVVFGS